jgi:hypothetical protein
MVMDAIGPGDFVECIDADECAPNTLIAGSLYHVDGIKADSPCSPICDGTVLHLGELSDRRAWFCAMRFKPIYKPRTSVIASLKHLEPA